MPTLETLTLFVSASVLLALVPGPDNIFVLLQSALYGRKLGIMVSLGLCTGIIFHTAAVALGVAALVQTSPLAFNLLKIAGALYLCFLAFQAFRASASTIEQNAPEQLRYRQLYFRGVIMNSTNPKVAIFFLAFLPQFINPAQGEIAGQIIGLGLIFMLVTLVIFSSIALLAGTLGQHLKSKKVQGLMQRIAGIFYLCLALRLVFTQY